MLKCLDRVYFVAACGSAEKLKNVAEDGAETENGAAKMVPQTLEDVDLAGRIRAAGRAAQLQEIARLFD
jgi:hypothetical protein